ncbi:MAG TPA: condensation domain-containing protein, partial [Longimicrobiaceae bacterium]|nr:condensation domain-containing protein [Longimicrobiaceae bacterium]
GSELACALAGRISGEVGSGILLLDREGRGAGGVRRLRESGARVLHVPLGSWEEAPVREAIEEANRSFGPITGVVYLALSSSPGDSAPSGAAAAEGGYVDAFVGAPLVDALVGDADPEFFLFCDGAESASDSTGDPWRAAAAAFLDALAERRAARTGRPALSVHLRAHGGADPSDAGRSPGELADLLGDALACRGTTSLSVSLPEDAAPGCSAGEASAVDRSGRDPGRAGAGEDAVPPGPVETVLREVWRAVFGVEIGRDADFFRLGGDSLLALQVVNRAAGAGVRLTVRQLVEHPTLSDLAAVLGAGEPAERSASPAPGPVPLTPIQRWFFEQELPGPHHYNLAVLLETQSAVDPSLLERAVRGLAGRHDVLRFRFSRTEGGWEQRSAGAESSVAFEALDLSRLSPVERRSRVEQETARIQASLDLQRGPLLRVVLFHFGESVPGQVLFVVHHLLTDLYGWRILLDEMETAYLSLAGGREPVLPPATTPFATWASRLAEYGRSGGFAGEVSYWRAAAAPVGDLPRDLPAAPEPFGTQGSTRQVRVPLGGEETRTLLHRAPAALEAHPQEILLAALASALAGWSGSPELALELKGHGREELFEGLDLSRTVGWFTTLYPVRLGLEGAAAPLEVLRRVRDAVRSVPSRGIGYGVLRYLAGDREVAPPESGRPEVLFNYLGISEGSSPRDSLFRLATEPAGPAIHPAGGRPHLLEINAPVEDGCLRVEWLFSEQVHLSATIHRLALEHLREVRRLLEHARHGAGSV